MTALILATTGTLSVQAQDPFTGSPDVLIKLAPGQPRELVIGPRGVGLCPGEKGCGDTVTFIWVGRKRQGEQIKLTFDEEAPAISCFGKVSLTLTDTGAANGASLTLKDTCKGKQALFYTVACQGGVGNNCEDVVPVDPGMIIDGGR